MICDITKEIVKISNFSTIDNETINKRLCIHNIIIFLLEKLRNNQHINCFFIKKSKILNIFDIIFKISNVFPYFIIISDQIPYENDEINCILQKFKEKYKFNIKKFYKFLQKYKLTHLLHIYNFENLRFTLVSNSFTNI